MKEKKSFKEKLGEFADSRLFSLNETDDSWIFTKGCLQITLRKSKSERIDGRRAEKLLNEGYTDLPSAGFYGTSSGHPYCQYKILPFNHDLEQKVPKKKNLGFIIQVGSYVIGATEDKREYSGRVQKFIRDISNNIQSVVILAKETGSFVELLPSTVQLSMPYPKERNRKSLGTNMFGMISSYIGGM